MKSVFLKNKQQKHKEDEYFSNKHDDDNDNDDKGSNNSRDASDNDDDDNNDKNNDQNDDENKKVEKIKIVIRKPQPKLDPTRLCGERGIKCLAEMFANFKHKGDGNEYRDLDVMISKYEFWSHRLFPKMKFVDIVEKLEKLGDKREVKRALYNIRLGSGDNQNDANMHIGDDENDPNVEDERMTARVMAMMEKVNATTGNDDADDDDDDDDELIRNTNFESAAFRSQSAGARQVHAAESQGDDNDDDALFNSLLLNNNNN